VSVSQTGRRALLQRYIEILLEDIPSSRSLLILGDPEEGLGDQFGETVVHPIPAGSLDADGIGRHDVVVSQNILQRLPEEEIDNAILQTRRASEKAIFIVSSSFSDAVLETGENAHATVKPAEWWSERIGRHFPVVELAANYDEFEHIFITWIPKPKTREALVEQTRQWRHLAKFRSAFIGPRNYLRLALANFISERQALTRIKGKSIAVVGNSISLLAKEYGTEIDAADVVIRFNRAPIMTRRSHGMKTDWIATGTALDPDLIEARKISLLLWMTKLRKMPAWMYRRRDIFLHPMRKQVALEAQIGQRPSTGFMLIMMLARSECREVRLYGFDFFQSLSLSGYRDASQVPHDFSRERELIMELLENDRRFTLCV